MHFLLFLSSHKYKFSLINSVIYERLFVPICPAIAMGAGKLQLLKGENICDGGVDTKKGKSSASVLRIQRAMNVEIFKKGWAGPSLEVMSLYDNRYGTTDDTGK